MDRRPRRSATEQLLSDPALGDPAGREPVGSLLATAARLTPSEPAPELLTRMATAARASFDTTPHPWRKTTVTRKTFVGRTAALAAAVTLTATGAAAAAGGALPTQAQDALADAAERVGFELPRSDQADRDDAEATTEAAEETTEETTTEESTEDVDATTEAADQADQAAEGAGDHGETVSSIARSDFEDGRAHGEAVSEAARQQGDAQSADRADADTGDHDAPVTTPNEGDAATEAGNPAADQAPATPNHGAAADDTPAADRPAQPAG